MRVELGCAAFIALAASGCYTAPLRSDPPVQSDVGITLRVDSVRCGHATDDRFGRIGWVDVLVDAHNSTNRALSMRWERSSLLLPSGTSVPLAIGSAQILPPSWSWLNELRYEAPELECGQDLAIDSRDALSIGGTAVRLPPLHFVPPS